MAIMVPDLHPQGISNDGERRFYQACSFLPDPFTVCYSYKYYDHEAGLQILREADFVIAHPALGFVVVEVKQGLVKYQNGAWQEFKSGNWQSMRKDPLEQAQRATFAILHRYEQITGQKYFPLKCRYALCFPETSRLEGFLPGDLKEHSVWLFDETEDPGLLESRIYRLFEPLPRENPEAYRLLVQKVLNPTFKVFSRLEEQIEQFCRAGERILSEEQERILEETELDRRKIFLGAAGTGKTFLAIEKARRLETAGKKVLFTCFNKNLAAYLRTQLPEAVYVQNIHDYFLKIAGPVYGEIEIPAEPAERSEFFSQTLPLMAFDILAEQDDSQRFDSIIIDEGQDFQADWFDCIEAMLRPEGELYVFADPAQSIFCQDINKIQGLSISRHRLTRNIRSTQAINEWMLKFLPGLSLKCLNSRGLPVVSIPCREDQQYRILEKEIGRLVSQGVQLKRITVLSPHVYARSCLAGKTRIKEWPVVEGMEQSGNYIRFSTIRSFKGLEADIVFLVDIRPSRACTPADIYVGGSRARFLLYVLHDEGMTIGA
ncbi:MAG: AAA family ATPase [Syntrophomonadaceae bacterium]|jgi:hypothetical protein|nr:AAA family ATPase [Syntrophomonadaceae bacterium]